MKINNPGKDEDLYIFDQIALFCLLNWQFIDVKPKALLLRKQGLVTDCFQDVFEWQSKPCESESAFCHTVLVAGHCEASQP